MISQAEDPSSKEGAEVHAEQASVDNRRSTNSTNTNITTTMAEPRPTEADIEEKPWKYVGYRGYSEFLASDNELLLFRRFGVLNARVALDMQDQLARLEERLEALDKQYSSVYGADVNNGSLRDDEPERAAIVAEIAKLLPKYNGFIMQQTRLCAYAKAPRRNIKNVSNWHFNHDYRAIDAAEQGYLFNHVDDMVCLAEKETTPLRSAIDSSLRLRTWRGWRDTARTADQVPKHDAGVISYYSDERMDGFVSAVIVLVGVSMLIVPIWILRCLSPSSQDMMLLVITVFVFVFLLVLSFFMATKPFEALGATAAYAAVLMVFLQVGAEK
ncbi:hypothetical protein Micbo1qcDRAFT_226750 [Microdochium bolleyi]|uniref:DUF6594 domain-containing protein n=1 Tax=Microdochium bolleyi TaxID=196109 RepID=A0A136J0L3_9PEZI|nr:hypothetical protein Micbo1qcDRAFT_226750 [Microdochium bolleyi]